MHFRFCTKRSQRYSGQIGCQNQSLSGSGDRIQSHHGKQGRRHPRRASGQSLHERQSVQTGSHGRSELLRWKKHLHLHARSPGSKPEKPFRRRGRNAQPDQDFQHSQHRFQTKTDFQYRRNSLHRTLPQRFEQKLHKNRHLGENQRLFHPKGGILWKRRQQPDY